MKKEPPLRNIGRSVPAKMNNLGKKKKIPHPVPKAVLEQVKAKRTGCEMKV